MTRTAVTLDDKYTQSGGRVFLSSNQALVRLPLDQARRDRAAGLKTAGYISGYRGSRLGVYDSALWGAGKLLEAHDIRFVSFPMGGSTCATTNLRWRTRSFSSTTACRPPPPSLVPMGSIAS